MRILAVDPGPAHSAWVQYDTDRRGFCERGWKGQSFAKVANDDLLDMVRTKAKHGDRSDVLVIERIASFGMPVGREIFDTCEVIGQLTEAWRNWRSESPIFLLRTTVKLHLCGTAQAKDANIRQSLIDAFGGKEKAIGKKRTPGMLHGVAGDVWSALALAVTYADLQEQARAA